MNSSSSEHSSTEAMTPDQQKQKLVHRAESCIDKLKLEEAVVLLEDGILKWPNDTTIIDMYTDLLINLGNNTQKAREVITPTKLIICSL